MQVRQVAPFVAALALGAAFTTGGGNPNGEQSKTAEQIVADAEAAATSAKTVHIAGSGLSSTAPLTLDLHLVAGRGGRGHLSDNGLAFDMIRIGPTAYFRGGTDFWRHFGGNVAATLFRGRWLRESATKGDLASFTPLTDIRQFFHGVLESHGALRKGATTTVGGRPAIAIVDTGPDGGTLYVATTGPPFPLALVSAKGPSHGRVRFSDWNRPVTLTKPRRALDVSKLKGK